MLWDQSPWVLSPSSGIRSAEMWSPAPTDALNCNIALLRVCSVYWPTFCISDIYDGDGAGWRASASSCCLLKKCSRMWSPPPPPPAARRGETSSALKRSIRRFVITEKAPTRAFSWLKGATTAFTFKTLLRHYTKWALTPRSLNVKLGPRRNYHKGRAAIRHYANQTARPL